MTKSTVERQSENRKNQKIACTVFFVFLVGFVTVMSIVAPERLEFMVREDAWLEWATFFAFSLAGIFRLVQFFQNIKHPPANLSRKENRIYLTGLLLISGFCVLAAGEEISWGQRLFGLAPPELFQKYNHQQEINLHNIFIWIVSPRLVFCLICFGYGVLLPWLAYNQNASLEEEKNNKGRAPRQSTAIALLAPPVYLSPWFILASIAYWNQPVDSALETAELLLSLAFFADAVVKSSFTEFANWRGKNFGKSLVFAVMTIPVVLGLIADPLIATTKSKNDMDVVQQAQKELEALSETLAFSNEFGRLFSQSGKGVNLRLANFLRRDSKVFGQISADWIDNKLETEDSNDDFTRLRRSNFLDPWHSSYWIYAVDRNSTVIIYSMGPNRRRDTAMPEKDPLKTAAEFRGDDMAIEVSISMANN